MFIIFEAERDLIWDKLSVERTRPMGIILSINDDADSFLEARHFMCNDFSSGYPVRRCVSNGPGGKYPMCDHRGRGLVEAFALELASALATELGGEWTVPAERPITYHESLEEAGANEHIAWLMKIEEEFEPPMPAELSPSSLFIKMNEIVAAEDLQAAEEYMGEIGRLDLGELAMLGLRMKIEDVTFDVAHSQSSSWHLWHEARYLMGRGYAPYRIYLTGGDAMAKRVGLALNAAARRLVLGDMAVPIVWGDALFPPQRTYQILKMMNSEPAAKISAEKLLSLLTGYVKVAPPLKRSSRARIISMRDI